MNILNKTKTIMKSLLFLMVISSLFVSCQGDKVRKLYIYNWTSYMKDEVLRKFEEKYNVKIVYDMFTSNEEMFAKLKAGATGYDIVVPSGDYVSILIKEKMVQPIDKSLVPNYKNISPIIEEKNYFDPGFTHCIPYMLGTTGIIVNTEKVPVYEESWSIFDRTDIPRMVLMDDMREIMGGALLTMGKSVNTTDPADIAKAKDIVSGWAKNIVKFDAESFGKGFASGEFWVVYGFPENVFGEVDEAMRAKTKFFVPKEGTPLFIDCMMILKGSKNADLAHAFMNFIHEPEIYAELADHLGYPSINTAADPLLKETPNYTLDDLKNSQFKEDIGETLELYMAAWQAIRVGK